MGFQGPGLEIADRRLPVLKLRLQVRGGLGILGARVCWRCIGLRSLESPPPQGGAEGLCVPTRWSGLARVEIRKPEDSRGSRLGLGFRVV